MGRSTIIISLRLNKRERSWQKRRAKCKGEEKQRQTEEILHMHVIKCNNDGREWIKALMTILFLPFPKNIQFCCSSSTRWSCTSGAHNINKIYKHFKHLRQFRCFHWFKITNTWGPGLLFSVTRSCSCDIPIHSNRIIQINVTLKTGMTKLVLKFCFVPNTSK